MRPGTCELWLICHYLDRTWARRSLLQVLVSLIFQLFFEDDIRISLRLESLIELVISNSTVLNELRLWHLWECSWFSVFIEDMLWTCAIKKCVGGCDVRATCLWSGEAVLIVNFVLKRRLQVSLAIQLVLKVTLASELLWAHSVGEESAVVLASSAKHVRGRHHQIACAERWLLHLVMTW